MDNDKIFRLLDSFEQVDRHIGATLLFRKSREEILSFMQEYGDPCVGDPSMLIRYRLKLQKTDMKELLNQEFYQNDSYTLYIGWGGFLYPSDVKGEDHQTYKC